MASAPAMSLAGRRILVVEDEYFVAIEIQRTLAEAGATVVGPVGTLEAGLRLAEEPLDGAVLDVNLAETASYPIAERLRDRQVPYMFLTGYDGWAVDAAYRSTARLAKPFAIDALVHAVAGLVAGGSTS